jgi:group I intron endonuclease
MLKSCNISKSGIYLFINTKNGKVYIGQAQNIRKRYNQHLRMHSDTMFGRALRKYGLESFEFYILELVDDLNLLNTREQHYLDLYQSFISDKGYNICPIAGNARGTKRSEEVKAQMSASRLGHETRPETRAKISLALKGKGGETHHRFGKKTPESTLLKLSSWQKGNRKSEAHIASLREAKIKAKKKIVQYSLTTGAEIKIWPSVHEVASELGISISNLRKVAGGKPQKVGGKIFPPKQQAGGFGWKWAA